jgi:hypothetical protein
LIFKQSLADAVFFVGRNSAAARAPRSITLTKIATAIQTFGARQ